MRVRFRDEDFNYRILGIDNGTTQVGMSVIDYDLRRSTGTVIYTEAFVPESDAYDRLYNTVEMRGRVNARIKWTRRWLMDRLDEFNPNVVGCESPFSHIQPSAYAPLVVSMESMGEVVEDYRSTLEFVRVPPGRAKKSVLHGNRKYDNDKDAVRESILTHPRIIAAPRLDLHLITPDEMDSIAVGWCVGECSAPIRR